MAAPVVSWPSAPDNNVVRNQAFQMFDVSSGEYVSTSAGEITLTDKLANFFELDSAHQDENSPILQPEELTQRFGMDGRVKFDAPMRESAAQLLMKLKQEEIDRQDTLSRGHSYWAGGAGNVAALGANIIDPINLASMFIPVVGETRGAQILARAEMIFGKNLLARTASRAAIGTIEGTVGAELTEPLNYYVSKQEQLDYTLNDSLNTIAMGGIGGGIIHSGLGALGEGLSKLEVATRRSMFRSALANILEGEEVRSPETIAALDPLRLKTEALSSPEIQLMAQEKGIDLSKTETIKDVELKEAIDKKATEIGMKKLDEIHELQTAKEIQKPSPKPETPGVENKNLPEQIEPGKQLDIEKDVQSKQADTQQFIKDNEHLYSDKDLEQIKQHDEEIANAKKKSRGYLQAVGCVMSNLIR